MLEQNELRVAANALLHQIDIGDFVDSHGHSAKMLKATHDLMRVLSAGYCTEGDRCVCGGDLPRVREGCANWVANLPTAKDEDRNPLQELGARLAELLDEDQWAECEALLLAAGVTPNVI